MAIFSTTGSDTYPNGMILQANTVFEGGVMSSTSTAVTGASTGLAVAITPADNDNIIIISCSLGSASIDGTGASITFSIYSSLTSGFIGLGTAASTRLGKTAAGLGAYASDENHTDSVAFFTKDTPSTWSSGAITYTLYMGAESATSYIGRSGNDVDNNSTYAARASSCIMVQEISA